MRLTLLGVIMLLFQDSVAQDMVYARKIVDTLASTQFWGRGYTRNGMKRTSRFLSKEFSNIGIQPLDGKNFYQPFFYTVNTFPGAMQLEINNQKLIPGKDFIVGPDSKGIKTKTSLIEIDSLHFTDIKKSLIVTLKDKLTWSVANKSSNITSIYIDKKALNKPPHTVNANIYNKLKSNFKAVNICGVVKGTLKPDSFIVMTAHYDHLGGMGKSTYFPGANDNASGISLMLNLAKYYVANPQPYSIAFICFAGEEAGLIGSKYFTEHPLIDLNKIKFLINVDLVGTGNDGITVVNTTINAKEFKLLNNINEQNNYFTKINSRGKAANSDHYWFTEKGVPAFFIYTLGGIKAYHDIYDVAKTLPLDKYENLFKLLVKFNNELHNPQL